MKANHDKYLEMQSRILNVFRHGVEAIPRAERVERLTGYKGFVKYLKAEFHDGKTPHNVDYDRSRHDYDTIVRRFQEFEDGVHADSKVLESAAETADRCIERLIDIEKRKR